MTINQIHVINSFNGKYDFLSNAYPAPVMYAGLTFSNAEAAYQAMKYPDQETREQFCDLDAWEAKQFGRELEQKPDWAEWNQKKEEVMLAIVTAKLLQNPDLQEKMLETGDAILVQGSSDSFWGVSRKTGAGENRMGAILMHVRESLKENAEQMEGNTKEAEDY